MQVGPIFYFPPHYYFLSFYVCSYLSYRRNLQWGYRKSFLEIFHSRCRIWVDFGLTFTMLCHCPAQNPSNKHHKVFLETPNLCLSLWRPFPTPILLINNLLIRFHASFSSRIVAANIQTQLLPLVIASLVFLILNFLNYM